MAKPSLHDIAMAHDEVDATLGHSITVLQHAFEHAGECVPWLVALESMLLRARRDATKVAEMLHEAQDGQPA